MSVPRTRLVHQLFGGFMSWRNFVSWLNAALLTWPPHGCLFLPPLPFLRPLFCLSFPLSRCHFFSSFTFSLSFFCYGHFFIPFIYPFLFSLSLSFHSLSFSLSFFLIVIFFIPFPFLSHRRLFNFLSLSFSRSSFSFIIFSLSSLLS